jgi:hypothetical protein
MIYDEKTDFKNFLTLSHTANEGLVRIQQKMSGSDLMYFQK